MFSVNYHDNLISPPMPITIRRTQKNCLRPDSEMYFTLQIGWDLSVFISPARLAQLGQAVQFALDNEAEANRDREEADAAPQKLPREGE